MGKRLVFLTSLVVVAAGLGVGAVLSLRHKKPATAIPPEVLSLPGDTVAVLGLDVQRIVRHPAYERITPRTRLAELWQRLEEAFGHHPERDVDSALLACTSLQARGSQCLLLLRGRFDAGRLAAAETRAGWRRRPRWDVPAYTQSGDGYCVALIEPGTLAVGTNTDLVRAYLEDRRAGRQRLRGNQALMSALGRQTPGRALWLVAAMDSFAPLQQGFGLRGVPDLGGVRGLELEADLLESADVRLVIEARDEEAAGGLSGVVGLLLGAASLQARNEPGVQELRSRVNVTTEGRRVLLRAALSYEILDRLPPVRQ